MTDVLDCDTLAPVFRERLGIDDLRCLDVRRGPVGNGQEIWFVETEIDDSVQRYVLRRTAAGGPLEWTDRRREAAVMNAVAVAGLPVPEVHWTGGDSSELQRPYFVMDRVPGRSAGRLRGDGRRRFARELGRLLARLHDLEVPDLDEIPRSGDATTAVSREIRRWRRRYREDRPEPVPLLGALLAWLEQAVPQHEAPVALLWGDPGYHNTLVEDSEITGMLDWELAHVGHPFDDLGVAVWMELERGHPEAVVRGYEEATGTEVDRELLDYFVALACVTRSVMVLAGADAFIEGRRTEPSTAGLGLDLLAVNLARAAEYAGWGAHRVPDPPDPPWTPMAGLRPFAWELDRGVATFLGDDVLDHIEAPRLRRGIKTAIALLETSALRAEREDAVVERRRRLLRQLRSELEEGGVPCEGGLEEIAITVESRSELAGWRPRIRRHLLEDLALQRSVLAPLRRLYG